MTWHNLTFALNVILNREVDTIDSEYSRNDPRSKLKQQTNKTIRILDLLNRLKGELHAQHIPSWKKIAEKSFSITVDNGKWAVDWTIEGCLSPLLFRKILRIERLSVRAAFLVRLDSLKHWDIETQMATRNAKRSISTILRKSKGLWTV